MRYGGNSVDTGVDWIKDRLILYTVTGSKAYGTDTEFSDSDFKGVVIPPLSYFTGLDSFKGYDKSGGENFKSKEDNLDISYMHINKFVDGLMKSVPGNVEMIFTREEDILYCNEHGRRLIDERKLFMSKFLYARYGGYAKRIINELERSNGSQEYNKKDFMHGVRILTSAIEMLDTGNYSTFRSDREYLIECRNGKYTSEEAYGVLIHLNEKMKKSLQDSSLPEVVDYEKVNKLLVEINTKALFQ